MVFPAFRQEASIKEEKTTPLRQRMIEDMDIRGLCAKTQKAHIRNVKRTLENCPDRAAGVESRRHSAVGGLTMAQMGFFDLSERHARLDAKRDPLIEIDAIVPWEEFRPALEQVWREPEGERKSRAGRKPMDAVVMCKTLVLGALYTLSDDQIEYQVRDRLSFMRFLGLGLEDRVPDARTVWLYREQLAQAGLVEALFQQFDGHLARQGCIARGGQIPDAAIVPVPKNRNTRDENKAISSRAAPPATPAPRRRSRGW